jgi:translation initiation factor 2-alpha kinase 4
MSHFSLPKAGGSSVCAVALQISLEKILVALAAYQAVSVKNFLKEQRSFGFWSPRRCDVYIVSYQPGYLSERLEVAALLWRHNISADVMYESGLPDGEHENHLELCHREGILCVFVGLFSSCKHILSTLVDSLYVHAHVLHGAISPPSGSKAFLRVRNTTVCNLYTSPGRSYHRFYTFYSVSKPELVPWLQEQLAEQKRIDAETSGTAILSHSQGPARSKSSGPMPDVQLLLPGDARKQRKQTKQIFLEKGEN